VEAVADAWLLAGTLPVRDMTCPGLPLPQPGQDAARGDATSGTAAGRPLPAGVWVRRFGETHA
jgi:hypothetical protein